VKNVNCVMLHQPVITLQLQQVQITIHCEPWICDYYSICLGIVVSQICECVCNANNRIYAAAQALMELFLLSMHSGLLLHNTYSYSPRRKRQPGNMHSFAGVDLTCTRVRTPYQGSNTHTCNIAHKAGGIKRRDNKFIEANAAE